MGGVTKVHLEVYLSKIKKKWEVFKKTAKC